MTVRSIHTDKGLYFYGDREGETVLSESLLELYQEPKKKKLLAVEDQQTGEVKFFTSSEAATEMACYANWFNAPEYDIEYPEPKQRQQTDLYV